MGRRNLRGDVLGLALAATSLLPCAVARTEPEQPATRSLLDEWEKAHAKRRAEILDALKARGAGIVPDLVEALRSRRAGAIVAAERAAAQLGPLAAETAQALADRLGEKDFTQDAETALAVLGAPAVPALLAGSRDDWVPRRAAALRSLGRIGAAAIDAVPRVLEGLSDTSAEVRGESVLALAGIAGPAEDVVAAIDAGLGEAEGVVLARSADAVGVLGPAGASFVPKLKALLDGNRFELRLRTELPDVRGAVVRALGKIGPRAADAVPSILTAFFDFSDRTDDVITALAAIGPDALARGLAMSMEWRLKDRWRVVLHPAATGEAWRAVLTGKHSAAARAFALAAISRAAPPWTSEAVAAGLRDEHPELRAVALAALGRLVPLPDDAVATLTASLADPNPDVRTGAAIGLYAAGLDDPAARAALEKAVADTDARAAIWAAGALLLRDPANQAARDRILAAADGPDSRIRLAAIRAAQGLTGDRDAWIALLRRHILVEGVVDVRVAAIRALVAAGPAARPAIGGLDDLVRDPTVTFWDEAARALVRMGERDGLELLVAAPPPQMVANERWKKLRELLDATPDTSEAPESWPVGVFDALPPSAR